MRVYIYDSYRFFKKKKIIFDIRKICELFGKEPAFLAIEDDKQREDIFGEYIYDLRKQEKVIISTYI